MEATKSEPVCVYCPANLHPNRILMPADYRYGDGIAYLCHAIMMGRVRDPRYRKGYRDGFVGLKAQFIVGRHHWEHVKRLAVSNGVVECDESYSAGRQAKGYRVTGSFARAKWERRELTNDRLARRLGQWRADWHRQEWERIGSNRTPVAPEVCTFLYDQVQRCRIREDAPVERFAPEVGVAVDRIRRGDWFFHVDRFGRIHTNLSTLKRELRPFLLVDGQPLVNVDIANSQPLLVGLILCDKAARKERGGKGGRRGGRREQGQGLYVRQNVRLEAPRAAADVREYLRLCERGEFYRYVDRHLPGAVPYDTVKQRVLASMYDKDCHRNAVYQVLNDHFPSLMKYAQRVKRRDYRRLAHLAQLIEARFMYGRVVPRLMRERPGLFVATIHDSVLVPAEAGEYVREVILSEFRRLGASPTVRIEQ